ncbi:hypothetical protein Ancab_003609 [Ancistrocladus abbreviatus]
MQYESRKLPPYKGARRIAITGYFNRFRRLCNVTPFPLPIVYFALLFLLCAHVCWFSSVRMILSVIAFPELNILVVMDNGIVRAAWNIPDGQLIEISYGEVDNLLEVHNRYDNRGYWDIVWGRRRTDGQGRSRTESHTYWLIGSSFKVIMANDNQTEISFSSRWDPDTWNSSYPALPINFDKRYIMLRGSSGFYSYTIVEREEGWPQVNIDQIRAAFKLRGEMFHYMAVADDIQKEMPTPLDCARGQRLDYKEAVWLTNPSNPELKGEVDDKYQYSLDYKDNKVHGWISRDPPVGLWMIIPSNEFRSGGPVKQDLTSHTGPTMLSMFHSGHYAGTDMSMKFEEGEPWKMVFGPFFIYLNSPSHGNDHLLLWHDAKVQMRKEVQIWPYAFPASVDFPKPDQRGSVHGRLLVRDSFDTNDTIVSACAAWVGLARPGEAGSWQKEAKGYQFWDNADCSGKFQIKGIREGNYSLYAWVPGFSGDYKYEQDISVTAGSHINLGDLLYKPIRNGPSLWQIGIPDRSAAEFFVPKPDPKYSNKVFAHSHRNRLVPHVPNNSTLHSSIHIALSVNTLLINRFRQYGLWKRYTELYPDHDLVYTVGVSDYRTDWFFAQVTRELENSTLSGTTWQIRFHLDHVVPFSTYTLRIAFAAATSSNLRVWINRPPGSSRPRYGSHMLGRDNAIARHGIHGLHWPLSINVRSGWLQPGNNTIYLRQFRNLSIFEGFMYDYIRFEGPPQSR